MTSGAAVPAKAGRREWIGLAVLALPCLVYSMDLTVLHLAVPQLSADLRPSSAQLLWIIDIYGFIVAGSLITMGTLGDRIGRRRLLFAGAVAFAVGSLAAAFSPTSETLIVSRALLGFAGATLAPSTLSLIRNMFLDPRQRTTAVAVWVTSFSVGGAIGPIVGGVLLEFFWWGSVFLINIPVMLLLLALGPFLLPEYRDPEAGRPDVPSALLSLVAILLVIFGLKEFAGHGIGVLPVASVLAGIALGWVFVRRQQRLDDPLVDLALFRARGFSAALATYGSGMLVMFGGFLFLPQYLQLVLGLSPLEAGIWTLPWAFGFIVGSMVTPKIAQRVRHGVIIAVGLLLASVGFALFTRLQADSSPAAIILGSVLFSLGLAPLFTLTIDLIVGSAPPERAGAASAISETSAEFSGAFGIALYGSIGAAIYRRAMDGAGLEGIPAEATQAARDTLGAAVAAAGTLPSPLDARLLGVAHEAFLDGLHLTSAISAVGGVVLAGFVVVALRGVRPASEGTAVEEPTAVQP